MSEIKQIFNEYSEIKVDKRNFDDYNLVFGLLKLRREFFLNNLIELWIDLYIVAKNKPNSSIKIILNHTLISTL